MTVKEALNLNLSAMVVGAERMLAGPDSPSLVRAVGVIKAVEMTPQGVDPQNKASLYEAGVLVRLAMGEVITPFAEACDALDRALSLSMAGVRLYPASTTAIRRAVPPQQSTWAWLREQERSEQEEAA